MKWLRAFAVGLAALLPLAAPQAGRADTVTVDVLFYVTPQAISEAGGSAGMIATLAAGVGDVNAVYNRSGLPAIDVRLLGAIRTDNGVDIHRGKSITTPLGLLDSDSHSLNASKVEIANSQCIGAGQAQVPQVVLLAQCCTGSGTGTCVGDQVNADQLKLGADLVAVITTQELGVGCLPPQATDDNNPPIYDWCDSTSNGWADFSLALPHEVSHNLGAGHLPVETNGQNGPGIFSYSFAHNIQDFGPCILNADSCSVVSLVADSGNLARWERLLPYYLSNPLAVVNVPSCCTAGSSVNTATGSTAHNNAETVFTYAPYVKSYRPKVVFVDSAYTATQSVNSAGTLQAPWSNVVDAIVGQNNSAFDECCTAGYDETIRIFPGSYPGAVTINPPAIRHLDTLGGPVTLGQ